MKQRARLTHLGLLFPLVLLSQPVSAHSSRAYHNCVAVTDIGTSNPDWMSHLPNVRKLSELSLPGTHDSMAAFFPFPPVDLWIRTQCLPLPQQLNAGIRVFDLRLELIDSHFEMYHGIAPLFAPDLSVLEFGDDVLKPIKNFLEDHPTEVIFMSVASNGQNQPSDFNQVFTEYMGRYPDLVWSPFGPTGAGPEMTNPDLGDVRGKVVILQNFDGEDANNNNWGLDGSASNLDISNNFGLFTAADAYAKWDNELMTQPSSQFERDIKHHLAKAAASTSDRIFMNHLSATIDLPDCGEFSLEDSATWVVCVLAGVADFGLFHPAFVASGHVFPFFDDSAREWTGRFESCDAFCGALDGSDVCGSDCFPDWPRRSCDIPTPFGPIRRTCIDYEGTNVLAMNYFNEKAPAKVGMIMADFPGPGLIEAIIGLNAPGGNEAPTVNVPTVTPQPGSEGDTAVASATFSDDDAEGGSYRCTVDYGDESGPSAGTVSMMSCLGRDHVYVDDSIADGGDPADPSSSDSFRVTVIVFDGSDASGSNSTSYRVFNVAPNVDAGADQSGVEGDEVSLAPATFFDPGVLDTHTATIDWGDGTAVEAGEVSKPSGVAEGTVDGSHVYTDNGEYAVKVCVEDNEVVEDDQNRGCDSLIVRVENVAPTVDPPIVTPQPSSEGSPVVASATFDDPGGADDAPYTCVIDHGDGSGLQAGTVVGDTCTGPAHVYADNGSYGVVVKVTDKDGDTGESDSTSHVVNNVAPTVDAPIVNPEPSLEGSSVVVSATFDDPGGANDAPYTCVIDHGDGSGPQPGVVSGNTCTGPVHGYADDGSYPVIVNVTDKDDAAGASDTSHVVLNVAPTATFANSTPPDIFQGESATLVFTDAFDPSPVDTLAYSFDCTNDGSFEQTWDTATFDCTYLDPGTFTARGRVEDDDGGFTDYTVEIVILTPRQAVQTIINEIGDELCVAGILNRGQCNSLIVKLRHAKRSLGAGELETAINQLDAFLNEVNAYINGGILTSEQGEDLIDLADRVIASIVIASSRQ